jgi:hypothetical protein
VALNPTDLIAPKGDIQPSFFPDGDMIENVTQWLNQARVKAARAGSFFDSATMAWVYYRAYTFVANRMASEPDQAGVDEVSRTISIQRVKHFQQLAQKAMDEFNGYFDESPASSGGGGAVSGYTPTVVVF